MSPHANAFRVGLMKIRFDGRAAAAQLFSDLRERLRSYPDAQFLIDGDTVTVLRLAPDGPDVTAWISETGYVLSIGGWHDEMPSSDATLTLMVMVVEGRARVKVDLVRKRPWRYTLQLRIAERAWIDESVLQVPWLLMGRRSMSTYYQQNPER